MLQAFEIKLSNLNISKLTSLQLHTRIFQVLLIELIKNDLCSIKKENIANFWISKLIKTKNNPAQFLSRPTFHLDTSMTKMFDG